MRRLILLALVVVAVASLAHGQALPSPPSDGLLLRSEGNELTAWRTAPVVFRSLEALTAALEHPLPSRSRAIRLVRASPPETIEYFACVTPEGTLIFGEEVLALDRATGQARAVRRGLTRAYPPLEYGGHWIWLVELPLSREATVTLEIRATTPSWPVRNVTIDVSHAR
jgi:hypothetical protein